MLLGGSLGVLAGSAGLRYDLAGSAGLRYDLASEAQSQALDEDYLEVRWFGRRVWCYRGHSNDLAAWLALWKWWLIGGLGVAGACLGYLGVRGAQRLAARGGRRDAWLGEIRAQSFGGMAERPPRTPGHDGLAPGRAIAGARPEDLRRLGLSGPVTLDEVRAAYRRLAKAHHPDVGGNDEAFRQLHAAYERTLKALWLGRRRR
jgi:hypothetical protein